MTHDYYDGEYIVWGPPGCGKTTFLTRQVARVWERAATFDPGNRTPCLVCSLTRAAAAEVAGRKTPLPDKAIGTLHSHAYRALGAPGLAEEQVADFNETRPDMRLSSVMQADADDADNPGWDRDTSRTAADAAYELYHLLRARRVPRTQWAAQVQRFAAAWESWKDAAGLVDFSDMIEACVNDNVMPVAGDREGLGSKPRVIIADEVQDHSALEYALLKQWGAWAGALIVTGDPYQALYGWRGADPAIFMRPDLGDDRRRLLSQSYRVPRAVHRYAMNWVQTLTDYQPLEYHPRDYDGEVATSSATWRAPARAVDDAEQQVANGKSVLFLTSCSYQLTPLLKLLRQRGLAFSNPWRLRRGDWNPLAMRRGTTMAQRLLSFLRPSAAVYGDDARMWTYTEFAQWVGMLKSRGLLRHGKKAQVKQLAEATTEHNPETEMLPWEIQKVFEPEAAAVLLDMVNGTGRDTDDLLRWMGDNLVSAKQAAWKYPATVARQFGPRALDATPRCHVGTVHSVKGGEADVVYLFPDLSPSGAREWSAGGVKRDSVVRLFYVAATRARERLVLCEAATPTSVNLMAFK